MHIMHMHMHMHMCMPCDMCMHMCAHRLCTLPNERLQACSRGYLSRRAGRRTMRAVLLLQRMLRGHLGRARRDRVRVEREQEIKARAKVRDVSERVKL